MIEIKTEPFSRELFAEVLPLAQKCWDESTAFKGETCAAHGEREFKVEPDVDGYQRFSEQGWFVIITLRDEGALKGYAVGLLYQSMHHKKILCGFGDTIYLEPEYRSHTWAVAKRFEKEMEKLGVWIIGWPVHLNGPVYNVLKAKGYSGDDIVMEKRICALPQQSSVPAP